MFNFLVNHLWFSYLLFLFYSLLVLSLARKTVIPNFLLRLLPGQSKRIVYYLLYLDYIKAKDNSAITYFFKKDSKSSKNPCIYNNDAFTFWKEIYECYPEILIYYLNRSKILLNDLKLIIPLVYQKGDPTRKNAILLKMIIEKAQIWATVDSKNRQNAARLGSIVIILKLTGSVNLDEKERMELWSSLLGILKINPFNIDKIFISPFHTDNTKNFTPSAVYRNGIKIYDFFKEINFEPGMFYVKNELNSKNFSGLFNLEHFK